MLRGFRAASLAVSAAAVTGITPFATYFFLNAALAADTPAVVLFEQPLLDGVDGNFLVPRAENRPPPPGAFHIILWQPNPNRTDGKAVPVAWSAGDRTGFYPPAPVDKHQAGFRDAAGTSTVQIAGDTVGAYINSADLPAGSHKDKMMMTPELSVAPPVQVRPFAQAGRVIFVSLELQVPTAVDAHGEGSATYITADLNFADRTRGTKISYGCNLFFNGHPNRKSGGDIRFDEDSQNMMINSVLGLQNDWITTMSDSASSQSSPWKGWKIFKYAITEKNFVDALRAFKQRFPDANASVSAADYAFTKFHLNAELHFHTSHAELGWSMRHARLVVEDATGASH